MKRVFVISILVLIILLTFGLSITDAVAETVKYKMVTYLTDVGITPVPESEKHAIGTYERRGVALFENGETAAYHSKGTFDFTKGAGPFQGYTTLSFKDGSMTLNKYKGEMSFDPNSKSRIFSGKGEYVKGTGRFAGIKGTLSFDGKYITPYTPDKTKGDTVIDVTTTYSTSN